MGRSSQIAAVANAARRKDLAPGVAMFDEANLGKVGPAISPDASECHDDDAGGPASAIGQQRGIANKARFAKIE